MKEIAVLAIARYGDMIQSTPLLRSLRHAWPDARITYIAEDRFSGILPMIRGYDRKILLNKKDIVWDILTHDDPLVAYRKMDDFVRNIERDRYDMVINLACTKFSAHLTSLMPSGSVSGFTANSEGRRKINTLWGFYVFSWFSDNARRYNRINLVDVFTGLGGVMPDGRRVELFETDAGRSFAEEFLAEEKTGGTRLVGLQLGASEPNRCWPAENFALLSDMLQRDLGVRTIMFGSPGEKHLAEQAMAHMKIPAIDAVGKTDLEGLFSLVKRCSALVSNDTGTMHFAAAAGVPAVMLCIGPAFFSGTGPYGAGHLALQPDIPCSPCPYWLKCEDPVCRTAITTESVFKACSMLLTDGNPSDFSGVKVYRSGFAQDGYLTWDNVRGEDKATGEMGKRFEQIWKKVLNGEMSSDVVDKTTENIFPDFQYLIEQGINVTSKIINAAGQSPLPVQRIKQLGDEEAAIEKEMKMMGSRSPALTLLVNFLALMRENIFTDELVPIAEETRNIYRIGEQFIRSL